MEQDYSDVREEFDNCVLSKEEHPYHRVAIPRDIFENEELAKPLMRWNVPPFGQNFPLFLLGILAQALELFIDDIRDTNNPFHCRHIRFNLPYTTGYDPSLPRVHLILFDGEVILRVIIFFDDGRVYGLGAERV